VTPTLALSFLVPMAAAIGIYGVVVVIRRRMTGHERQAFTRSRALSVVAVSIAAVVAAPWIGYLVRKTVGQADAVPVVAGLAAMAFGGLVLRAWVGRGPWTSAGADERR
jgi:hypothetical protein